MRQSIAAAMSIRISKATESDLPQILAVYAEARRFMASVGNPDQWGRSGYPREELLRADIAERRLFALREGERVVGAFALIFGDDPTYRVIEGGAWLNDKPYGTLHRLGSLSSVHGCAKAALDFCVCECKERGCGLRADTHAANAPMQHILSSYGFQHCGTIYVADGSPRLAYQLEL